MALSHQGVFVQTPRINVTFATNGNGTNKVILFTSTTGNQGTKVVGVTAVSTINSNRTVHLFVGTQQVTTAVVTSNAGNSANANVNMLANWTGLPKDNDGQPYLFLQAGNTLQASPTVAVTTAKQITYAVIAADF
jgi:hypothetical protein